MHESIRALDFEIPIAPPYKSARLSVKVHLERIREEETASITPDVP
jgi:hypothetical protein